MKKFTHLTFILAILCMATMSFGQWANPGTSLWTGVDPQIETNNPDIEFDGTSATSLSGLQFLTQGVSDGYLYYDTDDANDGWGFATSQGSSSPFFFVDDSWEIGVNTNNPQDELHIVGSGSTADIRLEASSSKWLRFYEGAFQVGNVGHNGSDLWVSNFETGGHVRLNPEEDLLFQSNGTEHMRMLSNGNFGIGTSTPDNKLHVNGGDVEIEDSFAFLRMNGTAGNAGIQFLENGVSEGYLWYRASDGDIILSNDTGGGGNQFVVDETGAIGIGTSTPDRSLEVVGQVLVTNSTSYPAAKQSTFLMRHYDQATHFAYFKAQSSSTQNSVIFGGGAGANYAATSIAFHTGATTTTLNGTERMRVRSDGRVRVGGSAFSYDFNVDGSAGKPGGGDWSTLSDRRVKTGIRKFEDGLEQVLQINPVFFQYKEGIDRNSGKEYVGIIAQEMQEVAPYTIEELAVEYEEGDKRNIDMESVLAYDGTAVRYMLVNAVKELAAQNDEKDERIEELEASNTELKEMYADLANRLNEIEVMLSGSESKAIDAVLEGSTETALLEQNQPNPFNESTVIKYNLPKGTSNAEMTIFNAEGKVLKTIKIDESGAGQINLRANSLPAGTYSYQLKTDAGITETKSMVVTK